MSGLLLCTRGLATSVQGLAATQPSRRAYSKIECRTLSALSVVLGERPVRAMCAMKLDLAAPDLVDPAFAEEGRQLDADARLVGLDRRTLAAHGPHSRNQQLTDLADRHALDARGERADRADHPSQLGLGLGPGQPVAGRRDALGSDAALDLRAAGHHLPYHTSRPALSRRMNSAPVPRGRRGAGFEGGATVGRSTRRAASQGTNVSQ